jgi:type II restriction enzyme
MVAGNAIERVFKNISELRNLMLGESHFPYVVFLQGSNFATETFQVFRPDGTFVEIRHDSGAMNRIDRVTAANYSMKINENFAQFPIRAQQYRVREIVFQNPSHSA